MLVRSIILDALVASICPVSILLSGQGRAGSSFCAPGDHNAEPHLLFFSLQCQAELQAEAAPLPGKVQKRRCWSGGPLRGTVRWCSLREGTRPLAGDIPSSQKLLGTWVTVWIFSFFLFKKYFIVTQWLELCGWARNIWWLLIGNPLGFVTLTYGTPRASFWPATCHYRRQKCSGWGRMKEVNIVWHEEETTGVIQHLYLKHMKTPLWDEGWLVLTFY